MSEITERRNLIGRILAQWYSRDAEGLFETWLLATQHTPTPMLRLAVDEVCANWTQSKRPQPGDLNATANQQRSMVPKRPEDGLSLIELQAKAREWLELHKFPVTPESVMRQCRARIGRGSPLAPLSSVGWKEALGAGVVASIPSRSNDAERAAIGQLRELGRAGYAWCDEKRAFVPWRDAVELDVIAERDGKPYPPRSMTHGAIGGAHAMLLAGSLPKQQKQPTTTSQDFASVGGELEGQLDAIW